MRCFYEFFHVWLLLQQDMSGLYERTPLQTFLSLSFHAFFSNGSQKAKNPFVSRRNESVFVYEL